MKIDDTSEEAVNINETTTESVEETEPAENAEKLRNTIMVSEISIFTLWLYFSLYFSPFFVSLI